MSARHTWLWLAAGALFAAGPACGGDKPPPKTLLDARAELHRAKTGPNANLSAAELHDAELALEKAEKAFKDDPDAPETLDAAQVAQLRARLAQSVAATMQATAIKDDAQRGVTAEQAERLRASEAALRNAQGDLTKTREQLDREKEAVEAERKRVEEERHKRLEVEQKLKDALDTLKKIADVKDDDRGLVVTFQGEALFRPTKWDLLPAAMVKLDQVAETLRGQERKIVVQGHTDNQGGEKYNQELSEKRANTVRDYLIGKGIPQDLVRAEGFGLKKPVAENTSVEGRAANRRVEIVVEPKRRP